MASRVGRHFTTVFDSNYLLKGLAMIQSLHRESRNQHTIHVLAMDDATSASLKQMNLNGVVVYPMPQFEAETGMDRIRKTRTWKEYAWTCGSVFTDYVAARCPVGVTYIDADLFWFFDPELIFHEIADRAIGITPHRFAKKDEARFLPNGKFNVQICAFAGEVGMTCLGRWARQCKDWCYYTHEDGKFGDQKYLDSWPTDYPGQVCEIANPGVGLAPWNIANYNVSKATDGRVMVDEYRLIVYHMHEFEIYDAGRYRLTGWPLREIDKKLIYEPYIQAIREWKARLASIHLQTI